MLDYSIEDPQERTKIVEKIIETTPPEQLTPKYLEILSDYIIKAVTKIERKKREIITENRKVTLNKRETSYEGLVEKFENGEDGVYNLFSDNRNILLAPKIEITEEDIAEIPELKELRDEIERVEAALKKATGKDKFLLKTQLIAMHRDQYVIKTSFKQPIRPMSLRPVVTAAIQLEENITMDENNEPHSDGIITLFNPDHIVLLLHNYSSLKEESWGKFHDDLYYFMEDLDNLIEETLREKHPLYYDLTVAKIEKETNAEIQKKLEEKYGIKHSIEYLSSLWCNKIPKMLREQAKENYIMYYFTEKERGNWKKCSRCGEVKLAHNRFFSKNSTSKDGYYSICKECRNKKNAAANATKLVSYKGKGSE